MIPNKSAAPEAVYVHAGQNQSGWGEINLFNKLFVTFFSFSPVALFICFVMILIICDYRCGLSRMSPHGGR